MKKFIIAVIAFGPLLAFAQNSTNVSATTILGVIGKIINTLIPLAIAAGVLYFIWGVIQYVTAKDEESQGAARKTMISGIIGLFVIVSIWGLVSIIRNTFGITDDGTIDQGAVPCVPIYDSNGNQVGC